MGRKGATQATSMKDVAKIAGVSTMTVSRAMRAPHMVSPQILNAVREAITQSGYVPNRIAGSLSSNRTAVVALIVPSLRNALYTETIQGISDVLGRNNLHLMISDSGTDIMKEETLVGEYLAQRVCGVVLHNTKHTQRTVEMLRASNTACVETGNLIKSPIDTVISYSNFDAGKAMAAHLLERGYRRLAFASLSIKHNDRLKQRRNGFLAGIKQAGLHINPALILETEAGLENGSRALARILEVDPQVDAVFLAGDVAAGAIFECYRRGIAVPGRIAIAASDDNDLMQNIVPALTTVAFPRYAIGVRSAEAIVARLNASGALPHAKIIDMGFTVIQRAST